MVPAYWYRLGIITCYFPETSTGTGSCCWRRYVSAHADRFIVQRACPGPRPGLTYLLVITLSCLNTPFLRGNSLRGFATCMRCFNGNLTFDHRYMVRSDVVLADDQEDVATGWPASGAQAVRGSSPHPCPGPVHLPSSCWKVPKGAGLS